MNQEQSPPGIWAKFGGYLHQDYGVFYPDFWLGIDEFWESLSEPEKKQLVDFLKYLNSPELPGGMQKKYWNQSGAQLVPSNLKPFLSELLARFESFYCR